MSTNPVKLNGHNGGKLGGSSKGMRARCDRKPEASDNHYRDRAGGGNKMCSNCRRLRSGELERCPICDGNSGRTTLCSKKCVVRFRSRRETNRQMVFPRLTLPDMTCIVYCFVLGAAT